jgi:hypothetical protein
LQELRKSFGWVNDFPDKFEKLKKQAQFLLWLLAAIGYSVKDLSWATWWPWLQPWSQIVLAGVVWFIAWKVAIAWFTTAGPIIWLAEISIDENYLMLDLRVKNQGLGEVIAHIYAVDVRDAKGRRIPVIDSQIEVHWRGLKGEEKMLLYGDKHGIAGVLQVQRNSVSAPVLLLTTPAHSGDVPGIYRVVPLTQQCPLGRQEELRLTLRIDFRDEYDDKCLKTKTVVVSVVPDAQSNCYRVHSPLGWWNRPLTLPVR